ncbi:50S ribosomal protein L23 [Thioflexithrix psekupsensis]|uniref:Large ribosomal subunit protein uL23 n=1 Tax=Thioflexithrix psekupsensis TaxID=1570016 RepID=A0A251XC40_9GAMM|nr:50S ribosomal protein L23 [Thioflexithrix psekupsensis]OUD15606.1 50S ribosomal protein L23 [Thioflexithrix psekupsensis]
MNTTQKMRLMQILLAPRVSEKTTVVAEQGQHVFTVLPDATKAEVKQAVEMMFNVKVASVQTLNVKGKRKNFGRTRGKRSDWKKAYVCLQPGFDINLIGE